jgi:hypothetical protein
MGTRIKQLSFSDVDKYAKASYKYLYELLPSAVEIKWTGGPPSRSFGNPDEMSFREFRFEIGHLIASDAGKLFNGMVYAHVTVYSEGTPRIRYTPEAVSYSVDAQTGKVLWYQPFDKLDTSSKSAATRNSWFQVMLLYYMLASGRISLIRMDEAGFHAVLKTVCWKLYGKEQVHQAPDALEHAKRPREDFSVPNSARAVKSMSMFSHIEAA